MPPRDVKELIVLALCPKGRLSRAVGQGHKSYSAFSICGSHPVLGSPHWVRPLQDSDPHWALPIATDLLQPLQWKVSSIGRRWHQLVFAWERLPCSLANWGEMHFFPTMLWYKVENCPLHEWIISVLLGGCIQLLWPVSLWPVYMTLWTKHNCLYLNCPFSKFYLSSAMYVDVCVYVCMYVYVWQVCGYTYVTKCIWRSEDNCVPSFSPTFTFITGSVTQVLVARLLSRLFTHWIISSVHKDIVLKHDMDIWLMDDRHASDCPGNKPGLVAQLLCHGKVRDSGEER